MSAKQLFLVSVGLLWINTSIQAEGWGRIKCLSECTDQSCSDPEQKEKCEKNCASGALEACETAKSAVSSQQSPRVRAKKLPETIPSVVQQPQSKPDETPTKMQTPEQQPDVTTESTESDVEESLSESGETATAIKKPRRPRKLAPPKQSDATYTAVEVNSLLKGLLKDQIKEITTGCDSAIGRIQGGIGMVPDENTELETVTHGVTFKIPLIKTGNGYIELIKGEKKDAEKWVESFDITRILSDENLKKYGIDKNDFNPREKLPLKILKKIHQKSQEKSLLVAQDCKVKSAQFQAWLEEYLAKKQIADENANKKSRRGRGTQ